MKSEEIIKRIVRDVRVELLDEFDRNFQRKAFFDKTWPASKFPNSRGSMMMRTGALRKGNNAIIQGTNIQFTNSQPYASIHNEGGQIVVTPQMKKFFWAMFYKTNGAAGASNGAKQRSLTEESIYWRNMAMKKVGSKIIIQQRQFIGNHPMILKSIERVLNDHLNDIETFIKQKLKR